MRSTASSPDSDSISLADGHAVRLLARKRAGAFLFHGALLLALRDGLPHRLAGGLELLAERGLDLDVGLELGPLQANRCEIGGRFGRVRERDERFDPMQQIQGAPAIVSAHPHLGRCRQLRRFLHEPQTRASPASRHLVAGALGHLRQRLAGAHAFQRGNRRVGVLGLEGDVENLFGIGDAGRGREPRRAVPRLAADRAEHPLIVHEIDDRGAHLGAGAVARHEHDLFRAAQRPELRHGVHRQPEIIRLRGEPCETPHRLPAHIVVRIGTGNLPEDQRRIDARDGGSADARLGIFSRDDMQRLGVFRTELVHGGGADGGIGVLPAGLRSKLLENSHHHG